MIVLKNHTMDPPQAGIIEMAVELARVGQKFFKDQEWFIDTIQGSVFNHIHWHARPTTDKRRYKRHLSLQNSFE